MKYEPKPRSTFHVSQGQKSLMLYNKGQDAYFGGFNHHFAEWVGVKNAIVFKSKKQAVNFGRVFKCEIIDK